MLCPCPLITGCPHFADSNAGLLKQHLLQGYTINKERIGMNYEKFMRAVADVKALLPSEDQVKAKDVLDLQTAGSEALRQSEEFMALIESLRRITAAKQTAPGTQLPLISN